KAGLLFDAFGERLARAPLAFFWRRLIPGHRRVYRAFLRSGTRGTRSRRSCHRSKPLARSWSIARPVLLGEIVLGAGHLWADSFATRGLAIPARPLRLVFRSMPREFARARPPWRGSRRGQCTWISLSSFRETGEGCSPCACSTSRTTLRTARVPRPAGRRGPWRGPDGPRAQSRREAPEPSPPRPGCP